MTIALLADAHIGGPGGPAGPLVEQLDDLPGAGCTRLVILGDLFQVWIGDPRFETDDTRRLVEALGRLRDGGVRLDYIEGNRDFFIAGSPYGELFEQVGTEIALRSADQRLLLVHGDGLNAADRQYLFWRWLSKSSPSRFFMTNLPRTVAHTIVRRMERRLAETNFKHKIEIPEAAIRSYATRRLAEGFDQLILGHFHEPRSWPVEGGEVRLLDAWFRSRQLEWLPL